MYLHHYYWTCMQQQQQQPVCCWSCCVKRVADLYIHTLMSDDAQLYGCLTSCRPIRMITILPANFVDKLWATETAGLCRHQGRRYVLFPAHRSCTERCIYTCSAACRARLCLRWSFMAIICRQLSREDKWHSKQAWLIGASANQTSLIYRWWIRTVGTWWVFSSQYANRAHLSVSSIHIHICTESFESTKFKTCDM